MYGGFQLRESIVGMTALLAIADVEPDDVIIDVLKYFALNVKMQRGRHQCALSRLETFALRANATTCHQHAEHAYLCLSPL